MRKIFSVKRRNLFSDTRRRLFCDQIETQDGGKVIICQDCGYEMHSAGNTTDVVCPNCGGRRFNYLKKMTEHQLGLGPDSPTSMGKTFSKRRSLFSALTNIGAQDGTEELSRNPQNLNTFQCSDCKSVFQDISETSAGLHCPNCGGSRIVLVSEEDGAEKEFSKIDEFLNEYSGKTVETSAVEKIFSERGIKESVTDLLDSGYVSEVGPTQICFSENSAAIRKLFSKLVISITKELDLPDPTMRRNELMDHLEGHLPEKGMMIIKKIHGICPVPEPEVHEDSHDYLHDSGIVGDLKLEHGGTQMPIRDFMNLIDTRYNDAPENIVDLLCKKGAIKISGANVDIN